MPKRQCATNRERLASVSKKRKFDGTATADATDVIALKPCATCPGVEALVERGGSQPRPATDLRDLAPPAPFVRFNRFLEPSRRAKAPRIGASIKQTQAEKERRLGPREEEVMPKPKKGPCTAGHTSGLNADGRCAECRRIYNRERYYARAGKEMPPKREVHFHATKAPSPVLAQSIERTSKAVSIEDVLADLRARRDALRGELAAVDEAIAAVERAQVVLGRPAA